MLNTPALCCAWRGACVPLHGTTGVVALATSTTAYCRTAETGLTVAVHGDPQRARSAAALCVPGLVVSPDWVGAAVDLEQSVMSIDGIVRIRLSPSSIFTPVSVSCSNTALDRFFVNAAVVTGGVALEAAAARLTTRVEACLLALCELDPVALDSAVRRLVGFGLGLTPSGDDALVGMLAALQHQGVVDADRLAASVQRSLGNTGYVSATMLGLAASGLFDEAITDVLLTGDETVCTHAMFRLLGSGATSGADTLFGLVSGLRFAMARRESEVAA